MRYAQFLAVALVASVLAVPSLTAESTTKPGKTAEAKVDKDLAKADHPHGFYLDAGASALFFNPPEKDSFPLYNNALPWNEATQSGLRFDASSTTVLPRFALGYEFARSATPDILGEDLKVEFSSSFFSADKHQRGVVPRARFTGSGIGYMSVLLWGPGGVPIEGVDFNTLTPPAPGTFAGEQPPLIMDAEYDNLDLNLGMRTDYTLIKNRLSISPYIGVTRQTFDQRFDLSILGAPRVPDLIYRDQEKIATESWGATVGVDFKVKILKRLSFTAGATVSPLWSQTKLKWGNQLVRDAENNVNWWMKKQEDDFTFRAAGHAGFNYEVNKWLVVGVNGGVDYWNSIPEVDYPSYAPSEVAPTVSRLPKLGSDDMLNWTGGVNFTVRFGGP